MAISVTSAQENRIRAKLQDGKYTSTEEVIDVALRLLDEYDRANGNWVEEIRAKIDAAIEASRHTPPVDGETFIGQMIERFQQQADEA